MEFLNEQKSNILYSFISFDKIILLVEHLDYKCDFV